MTVHKKYQMLGSNTDAKLASSSANQQPATNCAAEAANQVDKATDSHAHQRAASLACKECTVVGCDAEPISFEGCLSGVVVANPRTIYPPSK